MAFGNAVSVIKEIQGADVAAATRCRRKHVARRDQVARRQRALQPLRDAAADGPEEPRRVHVLPLGERGDPLGRARLDRSRATPRFLSSLGSGALLHDIGKLEVGLDIINKPGRARRAEEWEKVRKHPLLGAQMAAQMPGVDSAVLVPILEHHMRWDGSGYPSRTPRRKQHLASRIVAVADTLRRDDVEAQLLGGARAGRGDEADGRVGGHVARPGARAGCSSA